MTIAAVIKQIRALPYADMMMVAHELRSRIGDLTQQKIEAVVLADILSRMQVGDIPLSEQSQQEEEVLRNIFRRKLSLTIQREGAGWNIEVPTIAGTQVLGTELRPMFNQLLDQAITLHVLSQK
jgi:hypothetical protein